MGVRVWRRRGRARGAGGGLARPLVIVSGLLTVIIGGAFAVLLLAIDDQRNAASLAGKSQEVLVSARHLEGLILDIETGERGFVITGQGRFLEPWYSGRARFPGQAAQLERTATEVDSGQGIRARQLVRACREYINGYSIPTVAAAQQDPASVRTVEVTADGKRRVDALRNQFAELLALQRQLLQGHQQRANADAQRATVAATAGIAGSVVLILGSSAYLTRSVIRPVRRAAGMAGELAGGDLTVRMPETGRGEVGTLERSFNTMAVSLQANRGELRQVAQEQAALRRVATLVARGAPPPEVFSTVAREMGLLLAAACTSVGRYEPDGTVTVVGSWSDPGTPQLLLPVGSRWPSVPTGVAGRVLRSGQPARVSITEQGGDLSAWAAERGITSAAGSPIRVQEGLWGVMIACSTTPEPLPSGAIGRMLDFTDLVATAIANAESRAELTASRARVVAASDQTRRRIERDLHDGTQQRLISLGLDLRAAEADVPAGHERLRAQLSNVARGLAGAIEGLQEITSGLHPAVLSQGGLGPALRALGRRSAVPVVLTVGLAGRLPDSTEVAAYYVVSEALTNVAKHAHASLVRVDVWREGPALLLTVADDGVGGAEPGGGSGLIGLRDRVEALGGRIQVTSPPGKGTVIRVTLPAGS